GTVAMISAFLGMAMGQAARARLPAEAFRRVFLIAMVLLGLYLAGSALIELTW
ncbi:MAG: sulfite exporter TauE/SafE family protein, partial [Bradyrhizobium sp.]|nr:sulfite exporter TauE/SafE family protein [Bradyrhizobium sp.]